MHVRHCRSRRRYVRVRVRVRAVSFPAFARHTHVVKSHANRPEERQSLCIPRINQRDAITDPRNLLCREEIREDTQGHSHTLLRRTHSLLSVMLHDGYEMMGQLHATRRFEKFYYAVLRPDRLHRTSRLTRETNR